MPRKKIPYKDKAIIKKRLAQGQSLRKAIEGTVVKSPNTARLIGEEKSDDIGRIRENYLLLIEGFNASEIDRAELWAKMARATKVVGARIIVKKGRPTSQVNGDLPLANERTDDFIDVPDWANREKALKYIDSLRGIDKPSTSVQVNVFGQSAKNSNEFIEGEEV